MSASKRINLERAVANLAQSTTTPVTERRDLSGIIRDFELAYELSWKYLKGELIDAGITSGPPKDVFRKAYQFGLIREEAIWLDIIADRNLSVHVYDETEARRLADRIRVDYLPVLQALLKAGA